MKSILLLLVFPLLSCNLAPPSAVEPFNMERIEVVRDGRFRVILSGPLGDKSHQFVRYELLNKACQLCLERHRVNVGSVQRLSKSEENKKIESDYSSFATVSAQGQVSFRETLDSSLSVVNGEPFLTCTFLIGIEPKDLNSSLVRVSLNRRVFEDGDLMKIQVIALEDSYVALFVVDEHDNALKIFPDKNLKNDFLKAGSSLFVPPQYNPMAMSLEVWLQEGARSTHEMLCVLTSKKRMAEHDLTALSTFNDIGKFAVESGALMELSPYLITSKP